MTTTDPNIHTYQDPSIPCSVCGLAFIHAHPREDEAKKFVMTMVNSEKEKEWWREEEYLAEVEDMCWDAGAIVKEATRLGRLSMAEEIAKHLKHWLAFPDNTRQERLNYHRILFKLEELIHLKNEEKV